MRLHQQIQQFIRSESGATAVEYGLIAALIGMAIIASLGTLFGTIGENFSEVSSALE